MQHQKKLTKKQKRQQGSQGAITPSGTLQMKEVAPLTLNQAKAFDGFDRKDNHLFMHGCAGSGKTLLALYLALERLEAQQIKKVFIVRSAVPSRNIGFLPGDSKAKMSVYEKPYQNLCAELYGRADAYEIMSKKGSIEFVSTSFARGLTLNNCVIIVDEIQNMNWMEMTTILTRVGKNCKLILSGDTKQSDLDERDGKHDLLKIIKVLKAMERFCFVQMTTDDIVRSGFVKDFIIQCEKFGY
jgi:phosphate starvation-inducible protein PhoH